MAGAAAGDDGDLAVFLFGGAVAAQISVCIFDHVAMRGIDSLEHIVGVLFRSIDNLFHVMKFLLV